MGVDGFVVQLSEIVLVNLVLSGDNALLIAMAAARLPQRQRRLAMLLGILAAMLMRLLLTGLAVEMLSLPLVRAFGSLLLILIAVGLTVGETAESEIQSENTTLLSTVGTILLADLTMSLDNVAALAGMAEGNLPLLLAGMGISMLFMLMASASIGVLLERFPQLLLVGSGVLAWTAGHILAEDSTLKNWLGGAEWPVLLGVSMLVLAAVWSKTRKKHLSEM